MRNSKVVGGSLPFALGALGGVLGIPLVAAATFVSAPVGWLVLLAGALATTALVVGGSARARTSGWRAWRASAWLLIAATLCIPIVAADRQPALLAVALPVFTGLVAMAVDLGGRRLFGPRLAT